MQTSPNTPDFPTNSKSNTSFSFYFKVNFYILPMTSKGSLISLVVAFYPFLYQTSIRVHLIRPKISISDFSSTFPDPKKSVKNLNTPCLDFMVEGGGRWRLVPLCPVLCLSPAGGEVPAGRCLGAWHSVRCQRKQWSLGWKYLWRNVLYYDSSHGYVPYFRLLSLFLFFFFVCWWKIM